MEQTDKEVNKVDLDTDAESETESLDTGDETESVSDSEDFHINSKNAAVQAGGNQYNYFYNEQENKRRVTEYIIDEEDLMNLNSIYIEHEYDRMQASLISNNPLLIIYGKENTGRFTFTQRCLYNGSHSNIICINRITGKDIKNIRWKNQGAYIIRFVENAEALIEERELILSKLKEFNCFLRIIMDEDQYKFLSDIYYQSSIEIKMPAEKKLIVIKHFQKHLGIGAETIINDLFENEKVNMKISHINRMASLVQLGYLISVKLKERDGKLSEEQVIDIISNFHQENLEINLIRQLTGIQERICLFVISCLNGFTKGKIHDACKALEIILSPRMSEDEKEQCRNNNFWSGSWSQRLSVLSARNVVIEEAFNELQKEKTVLVKVSEEFKPRKIVDYFIEEYDWYPYIEKWLIEQAHLYKNYNSKREYEELQSLINALANLADRYFDSIVGSLEKIYFKNVSDNTIIFIISVFLRKAMELYENALRKLILLKIHYNFLSSNNKKIYLSIKICDIAFSDLYLRGLTDDLAAAYSGTHKYSGQIAHCLFSMIRRQEEKNTADQSVFGTLCRTSLYWDSRNGEIINRLLYYLVYSYYEYNDGKNKFKYPFTLFLFGKNKSIRKFMVEFFSKSLLLNGSNSNAINFWEIIYRYVWQHKDVPKLFDIYSDFSSRIKNFDSYCNLMMNGIEKDYKLTMR